MGWVGGWVDWVCTYKPKDKGKSVHPPTQTVQHHIPTASTFSSLPNPPTYPPTHPPTYPLTKENGSLSQAKRDWRWVLGPTKAEKLPIVKREPSVCIGVGGWVRGRRRRRRRKGSGWVG